MPTSPHAVTADDVLAAARMLVAVIEAGADADWTAPAGELDWDCWETGEHVADDLWWFAAHLAAADGKELPFDYVAKRPDGPNDMMRADRAMGAAGLARVVWAQAVLHAAVVTKAPPTAKAWHPFGAADPEAVAAMGVLETLAHTHDLARGLGVPFAGDADLAAKVLDRLMPDVERTADPWADLLWATGRLDAPDRPAQAAWRWFNLDLVDE